MSVQASQNNNLVPFIRSGDSLVKDNETLLTDAGRATPLAPFTLMAKVAASQKWVPFTDETAVNGAAIPQGVYLGASITAADIVAGDVLDLQILVGGACTVDVNQLIIENSKLITTVITVGTTDLRTVEDHLKTVGIFLEDTIDITGFEN